METAAVQDLHGHLEALALAAQAVFDGHPDIVEDDVADVGALLAHLLLGLADGQARQVALDQEGADPATAGLVPAVR